MFIVYTYFGKVHRKAFPNQIKENIFIIHCLQRPLRQDTHVASRHFAISLSSIYKFTNFHV